jgi:hypothetical protein
MKYLTYLVALVTCAILFSSCKKGDIELKPLASINITNAIIGGATARLDSYAATISNNGSAQFGLVPGNNSLYVYPASDSLHPYYNNGIATAGGDVYSLFLAGTGSQVDAILIKENVPYHTDSTIGVRFINLAPNSGSLNITLSSSSTTNQVSGLAYKQYSEFKNYPGLFNSSYTFQVRSATNPNTVLASFAFTSATIPRFANVTLAIRQNGSGVALFRINNDR